MDKPDISIIIPVYNAEKTISRTLDSVISQSLQSFEIILVNDCSIDNSMSIVKKYCDSDKRISYIELSCNSGPMIARNKGIDRAKGDYYIFLDSDDTMPPDAMQKLFEIANCRDADIVVSGYSLVWPIENKEINRYPKWEGDFNRNEILYGLMKGMVTHNLAFAFFRASLFDGDFISIPNQKHGEDLMLFYQLVDRASKISIIRDITYNYIQEATSSTHTPMNLERLAQYAVLYNFIYDFGISRGIDENTVLRCIAPALIKWYNCNEVGKAFAMLHPQLQKRLRFPHIFKYLRFRKKLSYIKTRIR